ncbi:PREDICTED: phosphatidylinositol N-acetylglucosaminyltransferase subunit P [Drosophila arizonae]|uniref:Phosphatidylinositol N-acetylglucosaminyltransferase subunit P n=1 Tax=Drosophila arizonae TaxID=7263 RepID=A0ABM1Q466_DROAR|nr:PREDICTED: phosphatidylinositol N-acetylglucosaminyltransferase subunit P [Drosophila arizonae]
MPEHTPAPTPHRAIYGFAFYILFTVLFFVYVAWAFLPVELGLHSYLPDKYFAVFVPVLIMVCAFFAVIIYPAINLSLTPNIDSIASVVDLKLVLPKGSEFTSWSQLQNQRSETTPKRNPSPTTTLCNMCKTEHVAKTRSPIPPLRFLDLQEINATYYN